MSAPLLLSCSHNSSTFCSFSWRNRPMQVKLNGEVMLSGRKITSEANKQMNLINKFSTRISWTVWMPNLHFLVQQKPKTSGHKACTTHHRMRNLGLAISSFKLCIKIKEKKCTWCIILDHFHFSHHLEWRLSWAPRAPRSQGLYLFWFYSPCSHSSEVTPPRPSKSSSFNMPANILAYLSAHSHSCCSFIPVLQIRRFVS